MRMLTGGERLPDRARRFGVSLVCALLAVSAASAARAANYTWTGGGGADGNWSNPANWGGTAPTNNEINTNLTFPALSGDYVANNDLTGLHVTFLSITTQTSAGAYTFTGNPISIEGPATLSNPGSGDPNLLWQIPLALGANVTLAASGRQTRLAGDIDLGARNLTFNTGGDIVVTGVISGSGNLIKNNTSALTLRGSNTFTGATTSNNGALYIDNAAALGAADVGTTINNGALSFSPGSAFTLTEPLTFGGGGIVAYGTPTIGGPLTVNAIVDVRAFDLPAVLTLGGAITGSGGLTVAGAGTVVLGGNATYSGATMVGGTATLQLDGFVAAAAGVTVKSGATLRGGGSAAGPCIVQSGGTFSPGVGAGSFGCGGLTMAAGATLAMDINGPTAASDYDQITVEGPVDLGGATLSLVLGTVPADGLSFTLLVLQQGQGVSGTFAGLPDGGTVEVGGQTFGIQYGESEVILTAAPGSDTPTPTPGGTTATPSPTPTPTGGGTCAGDCDGNGAVGINELILGVNIALGNETVDACPLFDADGNGAVAISELIAAVNNALGGCG